jgi:transposase
MGSLWALEAEVEKKRRRRSSQEITASCSWRSKPRPAIGSVPHSRQPLPPELPQVEQIIACSQEQCICGKCGKPTVVIGYETAEQLDREPAKYFVRVLKRENRACSSCAQGGVRTAALPARIIEKGIVSDRVIIDTVIAKYCDTNRCIGRVRSWNGKLA